jgi:cysteine dioxygenase
LFSEAPCVVFLGTRMLPYKAPMRTASLRDFISFLNGQSKTDFRGDSVDKFLTDNAIDHEELLQYVFFREETYGRNLICKTDLYELLVLTWLPQQRTPIHDHADQRCWMTVQLGSLMMKNYDTPTTNPCELVTQGPCEVSEQGTTVYIDDGMGVHSITNVSRKPAVSLHLYAGPVPRCRVYNEAMKTFDWVDLEYFTQVDGRWALETPVHR